MIDVTEHALRGMPLSTKLHRLAAALRDVGDCCWPRETDMEVIPLGGGRIALTVDEALLRIDTLRRARSTDTARGLMDGALITESPGGQRFVRVADPVSAFAHTPSAPRNPRRVGD